MIQFPTKTSDFSIKDQHEGFEEIEMEGKGENRISVSINHYFVGNVKFYQRSKKSSINVGLASVMVH